MSNALSMFFGAGTNPIAETVQVFRENAENGAVREAALSQAALAQFAAEFANPPKSAFDRFIDGLNRVPRPAMALGTLGLFVAAMVDPEWFASRMKGISLVPEPLWWLLGAIVGFYFGARHQVKGQEFRRSIAATLASAGQLSGVLDAVPTTIRDVSDEATADAAPALTAAGNGAGRARFPSNPALAEWSDALA